MSNINDIVKQSKRGVAGEVAALTPRREKPFSPPPPSLHGHDALEELQVELTALISACPTKDAIYKMNVKSAFRR